MAALLALTLATPVHAQHVPPTDPAPCADDTVRLVAFHYIVDGTQHERLEGQVGPGDAFTLVVTLQTCGSVVRQVAMDFEMPTCQTRQADLRFHGVEDLNSAHVDDDAESALVADLRAAVLCEPALPEDVTGAAIVSVTLGAIATLVALFAIRRG